MLYRDHDDTPTADAHTLVADPASEQSLWTTFAHAPIGMAHIGLNGRWLLVNSWLCAIVGYSPDELIHRSVCDITPREDMIMYRAAVDRLVTGASVSERLHQRAIHSNGAILWVQLALSLARDSAGVPDYLIAVIDDITKRRQQEITLQAREWIYDTLLRNIAGMAYRCRNDEQWTMELVSNGCMTLTGYPAEDLIGNRVVAFSDLIHPDDAGPLWEKCQTNLAAHRLCNNEYRIHTAQGEEKWVWDQAHGIYTPDGELLAVEGIMMDITEHKQAEAALQQLAAIVESSDDAIISTDLDGIILSWNAGAERLYGYTAAEVIGRPITLLLPPDRPNEATYILDQLKRGERIKHFETVRVRKDGTHVAASLTISPILGACGTPTGASAIARDLTKHKQLQAQLIQAQKMEGIGRLAGGIAHDFNNLLTAMSGHAELALASLGSGDLIRGDLQAIRDAAARAAALTHQLLAFARKQILTPRSVNLNDLVLDMDKLLRRLIGEHIELATLPAQGLWNVTVDVGQIEQVLVNLVVNARDAMPHGGQLTIETRNVVLDKAYARMHAAVTPGPHVMLAVSDSGMGMPPAIQARLFEPFFTTKEPGKGTGLGLATCYGIVKQHGGHIWVYSEVGQGTTFKVYLPRTEGAGDAEPRPDAAEQLPQGRETVLLVEDEPAVRRLAVRVLRSLGYTVIEAINGADALRVAAVYPWSIDLLLTDVVMPQLGGKGLAEQFARTHPSIKVVFMSGYTDNTIVHHGGFDPGIDFLQKPFTPAVLARAVRMRLDT